MASVVIENFDGSTPLREDGSRWPFVLFAGDSAVVADHNADLVNALDGNYLSIPEEDAETALLARGALATNFAALRQADLLGEYQESDGAVEVTEDDLQVITARRSLALKVDGTWEHPVKLVGIATDYAPYTGLPAPKGNIVLIDPYTDVTLLRTLDEAGIIKYAVHDGATVAA
jgi:hypothetical protein